MENYTHALEQNVEQVNSVDINIYDIPRWSHLSIHEEDEAFRNGFQRLVCNQSVKDAGGLLDS